MTNTDNQQPNDPSTARNLKRIFDSLSLLLKYAGIGEEDAIQAFKDSFAAAASPNILVPGSRTFPPLHKNVLGKMISLWRTDTRFLDDMANPKPLPRAGSDVSMHGLLSATIDPYPDLHNTVSTDEAIQLLLNSRSISYKEDLYRLQKSFYSVKADSTTGARGQLSYVADYLNVAAMNVTAEPDHGQFQRLANTPYFPVDQVPFIKAILNDQGMTLLENIDAILEERKLPAAKDDVATTHIGVGLYLCVDDNDIFDL